MTDERHATDPEVNVHYGGRLAGRVVIVSGGARGMGTAHVKRVIDEGGSVVFTDLREEDGAALARELGPRTRFVRADVTSLEDWERVVEVAHASFGPPSGLINNAGILDEGSIESTTVEQFRRVTEVLELGVFLGMKSVVPTMRDNGGGSIVNISSTAGLVGYPNLIGYVAAKWAVRGMTKAAALELAPHKIRVNSIHPGDTETPMIADLLGSEVVPPTDDIPMGRYGRPEEIAAVATFLLSDDAGYMTGSELIADGGYSAR
jgi:3alpha(or 20beta)-hydroxysteroid dehydrogenase